MKIILEDILDDIDLKDDDIDVVSRLDNSDDDIVNTDQFDFVAYIINVNDDINYKDDVNERCINFFNGDLTKSLDVYLDSYKLNILKNADEGFDLLCDLNIIDDLGGCPEYDGNVYCQIFFNFDGNLMHMLHFFDIIFCVSSCYSYFYRNHESDEYVYLTWFKSVKRKSSFNVVNPKHFFMTYGWGNYPKDLVSQNAVESLAESLFQLFWKKIKVLKLGNFNTDDERKEYILNTINKFINNKRRKKR